MKRALSILILVCANLILLAHSTMPHHHHDGVIVDMMVCLEEDKHHDKDIEDQQHDHNAHTENHHKHSEYPILESCFLDNALPFSTVNSQKYDKTVDDTDTLYSLIAVIRDSSNKIILQGKQIGHRSYLLFSPSFLITHANALRGPPIC